MMIQPIYNLQNNKATKAANKMRFGQAVNLPGWVKALDTVMKPVQQTRFREMMFEDIFGFAIPRTSMDLSRQYLFKSTYDNKRELNVAAARERLMMEVMGFMQWWVALTGNIAAIGLAKKTFGLSKEHLSYETSDFIKHLLAQSKGQNNLSLVKQLAHTLHPENSKAVLSILKPYFSQQAKKTVSAESTAFALAKLMNQPQLEWYHPQTGVHHLPKLLEETRAFMGSLKSAGVSKSVTPQAVQKTLQVANKLLGEVGKLKAWSIPMVMGLGYAYNFFSPIAIHNATIKLDRIQDYPGESGLRPLKMTFEGKPNTQEQHPNQKTMFPYLKHSLKNGQVLPLLISMIPLPLALGFFNTQKIATLGWKKAWTQPFKQGFSQRYLRLFQLGKGFPFATSQQISSIYAALIMSRIATARDGIEFRERTIDAFLGWTIWMLATPWLKTNFARWSDASGKTQLLKTVGGQPALRTEQELLKLVKASPKVISESVRRLKMVNYGALGSTLVLLGLVEPYIAIKLTEWQSKKQTSKANSNALYPANPINTRL